MNSADHAQPTGTAVPNRTRRSRRSHAPALGVRRTSFDLTVPLRNTLALAAVQADRPMVGIVEEAVTLWLRQHGYGVEGCEVEDNQGQAGAGTERPSAPRR